jgi:hypothetical protein
MHEQLRRWLVSNVVSRVNTIREHQQIRFESRFDAEIRDSHGQLGCG